MGTQTRRTVSLSQEAYGLVRAPSRDRNVSISEVVESRIKGTRVKARKVDVQDAMTLLLEEFWDRQEALEREFYIRATALAWGIVAGVMSSKISDILPNTKIGRKALMSETAVRPSKGSTKRQRFQELLETKVGKWTRRDSDNVYICDGPATKAGHYRMIKEGEGTKAITVSLVSLLARWNHIP